MRAAPSCSGVLYYWLFICIPRPKLLHLFSLSFDEQYWQLVTGEDGQLALDWPPTNFNCAVYCLVMNMS